MTTPRPNEITGRLVPAVDGVRAELVRQARWYRPDPAGDQLPNLPAADTALRSGDAVALPPSTTTRGRLRWLSPPGPMTVGAALPTAGTLADLIFATARALDRDR